MLSLLCLLKEVKEILVFLRESLQQLEALVYWIRCPCVAPGWYGVRHDRL